MTDTVPATPARHAAAAAENIHALNHATLNGGLVYPGDAYATVANLAALAMRLPQALQQIQAFIDRLDQHGHLCADDGPDGLTEHLGALRAGLGEAVPAAEAIAAALNRAHAALGPIGWQD